MKTMKFFLVAELLVGAFGMAGCKKEGAANCIMVR